MSEATERLVNLAFYLADTREPVTARAVREDVAGYPDDQDEDAFLRMFERDKKELRASGLVIDTVELASGRAYRLDRDATFQTPVDLTRQDVAELRVVGAALAQDPTFPLATALATALAKLSAPVVRPVAVKRHASDADEGALAGELARACVSRKRIGFDYRNASGRDSHREVEPLGIFLREGAWYLVARDPSIDETRVFAVRRMRDAHVNATRPATPDFDAPSDFDATDYARLPFQYGESEFQATLVFEADLSWRAATLTEGRGTLERDPDGRLTWTVGATDPVRLARWIVENGPGIFLEAPEHAVAVLCQGLSRAEARHA